MARRKAQRTLTRAELREELRATKKELRRMRKQNVEIWDERELFRKSTQTSGNENRERSNEIVKIKDAATAREEELRQLTNELAAAGSDKNELVADCNRLTDELDRATTERDLLRELLDLASPVIAMKLKQCLETFEATPTGGAPVPPPSANPDPATEMAVDGT